MKSKEIHLNHINKTDTSLKVSLRDLIKAFLTVMYKSAHLKLRKKVCFF